MGEAWRFCLAVISEQTLENVACVPEFMRSFQALILIRILDYNKKYEYLS